MQLIHKIKTDELNKILFKIKALHSFFYPSWEGPIVNKERKNPQWKKELSKEIDFISGSMKESLINFYPTFKKEISGINGSEDLMCLKNDFKVQGGPLPDLLDSGLDFLWDFLGRARSDNPWNYDTFDLLKGKLFYYLGNVKNVKEAELKGARQRMEKEWITANEIKERFGIEDYEILQALTPVNINNTRTAKLWAYNKRLHPIIWHNVVASRFEADISNRCKDADRASARQQGGMIILA